ncbi:MAG TPA: serine protease [Thermoanaerobaculia bacterium]|nr:serine protease [Thermoanaerobaculia bacterium]
MRTHFLGFMAGLAGLAAMAGTVSATVVIPPRIERGTVAAQVAIEEPVFDRTAAREIARLVMQRLEVAAEPGLLRDGSVQQLDEPLRIELPRGGRFEGAAMAGRIEVEGGGAFRLRFDGAPAGTVLWIAGSDDEGFIRFEPSETAQWGPTTRGSTIYIAADSGEGEVAISGLAQVGTSAATATCLQDVACSAPDDFGGLADATRAIGYIRYVRNGQSYVCTGGLVNDSAGSGTPYFLTARHCISTQEEAASVEVVWDLRSEACGSNRMAKISRSYGAQLLAASADTDVALLELRSIPEGRVFLGLDPRPLAAGTVVHRVSHAAGMSQSYSAGVVEQGGMACVRAPRPQFVYTRQREGAASEGSSGAPLLLPGLYVAGQLLGLCGADPANACASYNLAVDGSLAQSWGLLAPHLAPGSVGKRRAVR